jgi:hypothetical protein
MNTDGHSSNFIDKREENEIGENSERFILGFNDRRSPRPIFLDGSTEARKVSTADDCRWTQKKIVFIAK